jgi:SAM-dependent methyltransferase
MASSSCVFEVMIHCVEADAAAASLLQYRLHQDGIRASVTDLAATFLTNSAQTARYSLCFIGAAFSYEALPDARSDRFDLVFITSDADAGIRHRKGCTSYGLLLDYLTKYSLGVPISATALRRITQDSYDAIAAQFTDVWFDTVPCEALETLLTRLPRGGAILDAGCGPGHHTRFLKKVGFDPIGLDYSRSMLQIARKKNHHIPFIHGDILTYPLSKACFDGVWSAVALNHIPAEEVPQALANLVATLKCDGFIGLNFQIARPSELVSYERDHRFFEYPSDEKVIMTLLEALGVRIIATHFGTNTRNIHGLTLKMRFATLVGQKVGFT